MKNFLLLLVLSSLIFISCKKNTAMASAGELSNLSTDGALVASSGKFVFSGDNSSTGIVKLYKQKTGKYLLGLEQMNMRNIRDFDIYLSGAPLLNGYFKKLCSSKSIEGDVYYEVPASIDIASLKYILIKDDIFEKPLASAELK